jgi:hypothetical protein
MASVRPQWQPCLTTDSTTNLGTPICPGYHLITAVLHFRYPTLVLWRIEPVTSTFRFTRYSESASTRL